MDGENNGKLGGGFEYFFFSPLFGEDSQFDEHIFQRGWFNHQLENPMNNLLGQWLNFKLFGITYLVGKIKFKLFFSGSIG